MDGSIHRLSIRNTWFVTKYLCILERCILNTNKLNMYQNLPLANFRLSEIIPILWANDWARVTAIKSGFPNWKTKKN